MRAEAHCVKVFCLVMAGLVPAIPLRRARPSSHERDHRDTALRAGPMMTVELALSLHR
jgi:hypothetical protein